MLTLTSLSAQDIVDIHCHNILPDYLQALEAHDAALDETFPLPAWDEEAHLAFMDSAGIKNKPDTMLVRISEIDIFPEYIDEYMEAALTVGATSVKNEEGVICIYPMVQKRDGSKVRILEIYRDMEAYRHHISTPWFQTYKQGTLHMVKSLDLVDMCPMNPSAMPAIFRKINQ